MKRKGKGKFFVIEGLDGSGKGTVISRLKEVFPDVVFFREPGGTDIGEEIRKILLYKENFKADYMTETLLFYASRNETVTNIVAPTLSAGKNVCADRFSLSTEVFEFRVNGLEKFLGRLKILDELIVAKYQPELTVFLDVNPKEAVRRIKQNNRPDQLTRFDVKPVGYHKKIRNSYLKALKSRKHVIVDTNSKKFESVNQTIDRVCNEVVKIVGDFLKK